MKALLLTALVLALATTAPALASEEDYLGWSEVQLTTRGREDTGRVAMKATMADDGFKAMTVEAFGKSFELTPEQLAKLRGFEPYAFAILASHEAGYERLGGHTVYLKLRRFKITDEEIAETRVSISISKGKGLSVGEPEGRVYKRQKE